MTKEMRPAHRIDVLSHAISHYGRCATENIGKMQGLNMRDSTIIIICCNMCITITKNYIITHVSMHTFRAFYILILSSFSFC